MSKQKATAGNFFEDFKVGQVLKHATPRTLTAADVALNIAFYNMRFAVHSSNPFAKAIGYPRAPLDDLIVFHIVLGKTVSDVSLNAVANLGYAECRFLNPMFPGDTISASSEIIGLRENSNKQSGVVYVRTRSVNQEGTPILEYARWVMVNKRDHAAKVGEPVVPKLESRVDPATIGGAVPKLDLDNYDFALAGSPHRWGDYEVGEKIDHIDGYTIEEAEHQLETRLYQNTARVHFNLHEQIEKGRFKRRLVYGGTPIALARSISFNGLANAFHVAAINGGSHTAPSFGGDTIYAWSEILEKAEIPGRGDIGALRVRMVAVKNRHCHDFPLKTADGKYEEGVVLDLDWWLALPR
jgi:2-methylfumaryl-CoA hydratase